MNELIVINLAMLALVLTMLYLLISLKNTFNEGVFDDLKRQIRADHLVLHKQIDRLNKIPVKSFLSELSAINKKLENLAIFPEPKQPTIKKSHEVDEVVVNVPIDPIIEPDQNDLPKKKRKKRKKTLKRDQLKKEFNRMYRLYSDINYPLRKLFREGLLSEATFYKHCRIKRKPLRTKSSRLTIKHFQKKTTNNGVFMGSNNG